ncbi:hypothetical protein C8J56DRAFT_900786 [Mycena floridula]|nr:hypothetical protein C8J56DRAFT_900786 [Mycena floridula]
MSGEHVATQGGVDSQDEGKNYSQLFMPASGLGSKKISRTSMKIDAPLSTIWCPASRVCPGYKTTSLSAQLCYVSPKVREEYPPFAPLPSLASSGGPPNQGVSGGHAKDSFPLLPYTEGDRRKAFSKTGLISKKKSNPRIEPGTTGVKGRGIAARRLSD